MNNLNVINEINAKSTAALAEMKDRTFREFTLRELDFENGISLRGIPLREQAAKAVLGTLKVKNNFTDMVGKMSPEDWSTVSYKLKQAEGETKLYGSITGDEENREITWVYGNNENKKVTDDQVNYENYFRWLTTSLADSDKNYKLNDFNFNKKEDIFNLTLLEVGQDIDIFGTGLDVWSPGQRFTFSGLYYNYAPFFERLSCSNGMVARQYGSGSNISKQRYNNSKIESNIRKAITSENTDIPGLLYETISHLKDNNVSIAEFHAYKKFFQGRNEHGRYNKIIDTYFDEKPFFKAYGVNVEEKSGKWKSTANSGINAYDFFNHLTWLASHPDEVKMDNKHRLELQIHASNLFFKKDLDLEDIATQTNVEYARLTTML